MLRFLQLPLSTLKCPLVPREAHGAHLFQSGAGTGRVYLSGLRDQEKSHWCGTDTESKSMWTFPWDSLSAQLGRAVGNGLAPTQFSEPMSSMWSHDQEGHLPIKPQSLRLFCWFEAFFLSVKHHTPITPTHDSRWLVQVFWAHYQTILFTAYPNLYTEISHYFGGLEEGG